MRKPISVWVDGVKVDSLVAAYRKIKIFGSMDQTVLFREAAKEGRYFRGHFVSFAEPKKKPISIKPIYHPFVRHNPLLPGLCIHRLGSYGSGGEW